MIGSDSQTGSERFTFGHIHLYDGIDFLIAIVGLFAISEVLIFIEHHQGGAAATSRSKIGRHRWPDFGTLKRSIGTIARSTGIGFLSGVLPGAGASLGSFLSYSVEKNLVDPEGKTFGKGDPRGVIAPEVGNNASAAGALVPMLSLGVPGSGTTAVLLAVLLQLNITPGPLLFRNNPDVVWSLIAALFIGNFMLLALNLPLVGLFTRVLMIPTRILMPAVAMISFVGIYGLTGSTFDVMLMVGFGFAGWGLRKLGVPLVPVILGILLGNEMEVNLRRALQISDGDWSIMVGSPLAIGIWAVAIAGFVLPMFLGKKIKKQMKAGHSKAELEEVDKGGD
jgi:putative tricarboxylic transport membrane protein